MYPFLKVDTQRNGVIIGSERLEDAECLGTRIPQKTLDIRGTAAVSDHLIIGFGKKGQL